MKLYFFIDKNKLIRQDDEIITSFSKYYNKCYFVCNKPLKNMYKYALFIDALGNQEVQDLGIGRRTSCIIPEEILKSNYFSVSVFANDRFTTTKERIIVSRSGFNETTESMMDSYDDPTESEFLIEDEERIFWDIERNYRHNRFEIQEHPYTMG